jgi:hypothetical protein
MAVSLNLELNEGFQPENSRTVVLQNLRTRTSFTRTRDIDPIHSTVRVSALN